MQVGATDTSWLNQYRSARQAVTNLGDQGSESVHKETFQSSDGGPIPLGGGTTTVELHTHHLYSVTQDVPFQDEKNSGWTVKTGTEIGDNTLSTLTLSNGLEDYGHTVRTFTETPGHLDIDQRVYNYGTHLNIFEHETIDSNTGEVLSYSTAHS